MRLLTLGDQVYEREHNCGDPDTTGAALDAFRPLVRSYRS